VQRTIRQHSVPRSYLRRFTFGPKELIWCFDKTKPDKPFPTGLMNVAQDRCFYDLPDDFVEKAMPPGSVVDLQVIEKCLGQKDAQLKEGIDELLETVERKGIGREWRIKFSPLVIIQYLRTRGAREGIDQSRVKMFDILFREYLKRKHPEFPQDGFEITSNREALPVDQAQQLLNEDQIVNLSMDLLKHIWVVWVNPTVQPFYTSDEPVVKKANKFADFRSFTGFRAPGIEIAFPVSPRHLLCMYERSHFPQYARLDNCAARINPFGVERYNVLQVKRSTRQVFCSMKAFEQAEGVCRRFPEVCDPNRPRVRVEQKGDLIGHFDVD
jgi:hypothetical protein